jgi:hypothetical protein
MKYSAKSYVFLTFVCVGFVELFGVRFCHKTEQPTRVFYLIPPNTPGFGYFVHGSTARRLLVTHGRCLWLLGNYCAKLASLGTAFNNTCQSAKFCPKFDEILPQNVGDICEMSGKFWTK